METEIFTGKIFRLTTERLNQETCYERVYQRSGVTILPMVEGKLRLLQKTTVDNPKFRTRPISAYIDDGEDPLECAKRELAEEVGLVAAEWELFTTTELEGGLKHTQYFFLVRNLSPFTGTAEKDPNEHIAGTIDLGLDEVLVRALDGEFGTASNAFAIVKFVLQF
jgi:ADP-ribose pyrophosphatase